LAFGGFTSGGAFGGPVGGAVGDVVGVLGVVGDFGGGVAGVAGVLTPRDCNPGEGARSVSVFLATVVGRSVATAIGSGSAGRINSQHITPTTTSTTLNAPPPTSHGWRKIVPNRVVPVGPRSSVDGAAATRSSGGGPDGCGSRTGAATGVQPGGGATWTMLRHFGHSRICPMAASERTASRVWHVVQKIEKIAFSTVPSANG